MEVEDDVSYLLSLPIEVREKIMLGLHVKDVLNYCAVSKELKRSCDKDYFWQRKFFTDFPYISKDYVPEGTWEQVYRDFSTKLLKRVRFGVGTDVEHLDFMEATTTILNDLLGLEEEGINTAYEGEWEWVTDDPEAREEEIFGYIFSVTDGTEVYDLLEPDHEKLKEFYFMMEDLPVGYVREEEIVWEGTNVFEHEITITPVLFRFVKTALGEGFIEWKLLGQNWIIEFHNLSHDFNGLPAGIAFVTEE